MFRCRNARNNAAQEARCSMRPFVQPSPVDHAARPDVPTLVPHGATILAPRRPRKPAKEPGSGMGGCMSRLPVVTDTPVAVQRDENGQFPAEEDTNYSQQFARAATAPPGRSGARIATATGFAITSAWLSLISALRRLA